MVLSISELDRQTLPSMLINCPISYNRGYMTSHDTPLVSVIVPVYNVEKFLEQCVGSILVQTYRNLEIILVDDGSPDSSGLMCDKLAKKDKRIKVIHKNNEGLNFARKTGFENSTGELITFVDSDDVISKNFVEYLMTPLLTGRYFMTLCSFSMFTSRVPEEDNDARLLYKRAEEVTRDYLRGVKLEGKFFLQTAHMKMFRRELIESIDWDISNYRINEDEMMSIYFYKDLRKNDEVCFIDNKLYYYRQSSDSIMSKARNEYENSYFGESIDRFEFLERLYQRRLEAFGERYLHENAMGYSVHFLVYLYDVYRRFGYELDDEERLQYNRKIDTIIAAHDQYGLWSFYTNIGEYIKKEKNIDGFYGYIQDHPLVSIIVPVYNAERYINACIDSLTSQTYGNVEIILVNDGSTDSSGGICDDYTRSDNRVTVIHQENQGVSVARNRGILEAHGEYLLFVDADDYIGENVVQNMMAGVMNGEDVDIVAGNFLVFNSDGYVGEPVKPNIPAGVLSYQDEEGMYLYGLLTTLNSACGKLIRKSVITENGILFSEELKIAEDLEFMAKAILKSESILYLDEPLYFYRRDHENSSSAMSVMSEKKAYDFGKSLKRIAEYARENGLDTKIVKRALERTVIEQSLYALDVSEKQPTLHQKVFDYIHEDLLPFFNISNASEYKDTDDRLEYLINGDYVKFLMFRLAQLSDYTSNRVGAVEYLESKLEAINEDIEGMAHEIDSLRGEIKYLKSPIGMMKTPLSRVYQGIRRRAKIIRNK